MFFYATAWSMSVRGEFEQALLIERVANRTDRVAFEHDSPEALAKYLKDNPGADKSKHTVKKPKDAKPGSKDKSPAKAKDKATPKKETARSDPKKLKAEADAAEKAGDFAKARDHYSDAAKEFKAKGDNESAKLMEDMATEMAKWVERQKPKVKTRADYQKEHRRRELENRSRGF